MTLNTHIPLRSITLNRTLSLPEKYPFTLPIIRKLDSLSFENPVTFFVGENGCGKSTLLEAIACASGSITVGSLSIDKDPSLDHVRPLADTLRLVWSKKTRRGFFMRSEDFFGFARKVTAMREELQDDLDRVDKEYANRSETARQYARSSYAGQLGALGHDYGQGLDAQSHGESYLKLFQARFVPGGLYLLDEPEAPLSPLRQLSFLLLLKQMVAQQAQFIIATHSPILMAYPGAVIYSMDSGKIEAVAYQDLEHVQIMKTFLDNPENYLRHLMNDG